jgi:hypothetical protein
MMQIYKHPNLVGQGTIVSVQGQQDGLGKEGKQLEQGGNVNENLLQMQNKSRKYFFL